MKCNNCGADIAPTSKFCGYCGNPIEQLQDPIIVQPQNNNQINNGENTVDTKVESGGNGDNVLIQNNDSIINNDQDLTANLSMDQSNLATQNIQNYEEHPQEKGTNEHGTKKKKNMIIFIVLGAVLILASIILLLVAFKKSSNDSISVLTKAVNNLAEKSENSGTINTSILFENGTFDSMNLSASVKYQKINDLYNLSLTLNKSLLFDEVNLYSVISDKSLTLYANSSLLDMLGLTSSDSNMWLYYFLDLSDFIQSDKQDNYTEVDFSKFVDNNHFKYIDKKDGLNHYQLIMDNQLMKKLESSMDLSEDERKELEDSIEIDNNEKYILDFYINDSNEIVKISMNLTEFIENEDISKAIISFEFVDFNNTIVAIPEDAVASQMDIITYLSEYSNNNNDSSIGSDDSVNFEDINSSQFDFEL